MVNSQKKSAERSEVVCDSDKLLVRNVWVNSECQCNVLSVTSYISHTGKRLALCVALKTALVCEIIVIWIIPCKRDICVFHDLRNSSRELLVQRIVAVHKAYAPVRSAHFVKNVILIYILSTLRTVTKVNSTFCLAHVQ